MFNDFVFKEFAQRELNLSEEKAMLFVRVLEKMQNSNAKKISEDYRSIFKEDLHKIEISIRSEMNNNTRWIVGMMFALAIMIVGLYLKN